jgi:hypothetical protein
LGSLTHAKIIFKIQKRIIRIITNSHNVDSCRNLFKELRILPLQSQYIFLILPAALGPGVYSASNRNEFQKHKNNVSVE